jgi:hypothetical protein
MKTVAETRFALTRALINRAHDGRMPRIREAHVSYDKTEENVCAIFQVDLRDDDDCVMLAMDLPRATDEAAFDAMREGLVASLLAPATLH